MDASLISAAHDGMLHDVRTLLLNGAKVNATGDRGVTALISASRRGHTDVAIELLKHDGIDVNQQDQNGGTALLIAIRHGHIDIAAELLKHGEVDVNHLDTS
jgi:ankyrin repeat protein